MHKKTHSEVVYTLEELQKMFKRLKREEYQFFTPFLEKIILTLQKEGLTDSNKILKIAKSRKKIQPILEKHDEISRELGSFMRKTRSLIPQKHSIRNLPSQIITDSFVAKLKSEDITNTWDLLDKVASRAKRLELTGRLELDSQVLQEVVEYADLMRLMYIGNILAVKYHHAGITGVIDLANCDPDKIHEQMIKNSEKEKSKPPLKADILNNIARAKELSQIFPLIEK